MPTYEYVCAECNHRFEVFQKVTERPATRCPKCRGRVRKVFSPVGIIFKGPGFHCTDYRSDKGKSEEAEPAKAASKTAASDD
jgi:putative FmdB family regulatory protein